MLIHKQRVIWLAVIILGAFALGTVMSTDSHLAS